MRPSCRLGRTTPGVRRRKVVAGWRIWTGIRTSHNGQTQGSSSEGGSTTARLRHRPPPAEAVRPWARGHYPGVTCKAAMREYEFTWTCACRNNTLAYDQV